MPDLEKVTIIDPDTEAHAGVSPAGALLVSPISGMNIPTHDYVGMSYTGNNLTQMVFKTGGSGGTTVATLTLAYTGNNLTSVTRT